MMENNINILRIKRVLLVICGGMFLFLFVVSFTQPKSYRSHPKTDGYVPNEETAIKIAEAIWFPIYGEEIYDHKPFKAKLVNGTIWRVTGTVHTELGGVPIAEIQKSDCRILKVIHEK
jgi:hypothetical protein